MLQLWRAKWLMFLVFLPIALVGLTLMLLLPAKYPASARVLVWPGQETGSASADEIVRAEAELARSPVLAGRVIGRIGLSRLYPEIARANGTGQGQAGDPRALDAFAQDFVASSSPRSSILTLTYQHSDPQLAADTLNALVEEYLVYRRAVLAGGDIARLSGERNAVEAGLAAAEEALQQYLERNGLVDFEAETAAASHQIAEISTEIARVEAGRREAEARADGLRRQMRATPAQAELQVESASTQELEKLQLQRQELLARYRPDSRAVQDIDKRIAQLETWINSSPGGGLRRLGPNPTFQALETRAAAETANLAALGGKAAELARQKELAASRLANLAALAPEYQRLRRDRDALASQAADLASREQTVRIREDLSTGAVGNVSIYEPARPPARDAPANRNIGMAVAAFGLLAALAAGLLSIASVRSFPLAAALERTLGLRVLATTRDRTQP
jgi:uncharacterized protein involved in exopolysaccharide biosynthesis